MSDGTRAYAVGLVSAGIPKDDSATALPLPGTSLTSQLAQMLPSAVADTLTLSEEVCAFCGPSVYGVMLSFHNTIRSRKALVWTCVPPYWRVLYFTVRRLGDAKCSAGRRDMNSVHVSCGRPCTVSCSDVRLRPEKGRICRAGTCFFLLRYRKPVCCNSWHIHAFALHVLVEKIPIFLLLLFDRLIALGRSRLTFRVVLTPPPDLHPFVC